MGITRARIVTIVTGAVASALLLMPTYHLPYQERGVRSFATPPIVGAVYVGQIFEMTAPNLNGITVQPVPADDTRGRLEFRLVDLTSPSQDVVRRMQVEAQAVGQGSYRWSFDPIPDSKRREYLFQVVSSADNPASGPAFRAARGDGYERGDLLINGVERWADLVFRAEAPNPRVWQLIARAEGPGGFRVAYLIIPAMILLWTCVAIALRALDSSLP